MSNRSLILLSQRIHTMKNTRITLLGALAILSALTFTACPPVKPGGGSTDTTHVDSLPPAPSHDYGSAIINLERTVCFGKCPSYTLQIEGNGKVSYNGRDFVAVKGLQTSQISPDAVKALVDEFLKLDFFSLPDSMVQEVTDVPDVTIGLTLDGKRKSIFDRMGSTPEIQALENRVDQVANSAQWVMAPER
jgi:Domain of unknown function (DUF6438)